MGEGRRRPERPTRGPEPGPSHLGAVGGAGVGPQTLETRGGATAAETLEAVLRELSVAGLRKGLPLPRPLLRETGGAVVAVVLTLLGLGWRGKALIPEEGGKTWTAGDVSGNDDAGEGSS